MADAAHPQKDLAIAEGFSYLLTMRKRMFPISLASCLIVLGAAKADRQANKPDQNTPSVPQEIYEKADWDEQDFRVTYETFLMPLAEAANISRSGSSDPEIYQKLIERLNEGKVEQSVFTSLRVEKGRVFSSRGVIHEINPTEFEPPEMPNAIGLSPEVMSRGKNDQAKPMGTASSGFNFKTNATPAAFEDYRPGLEFQILIPSVDKKGNPRVVFSAVHCESKGRNTFGQGFATVTTPRFERIRFDVAATYENGSAIWVGSQTVPTDPNAENSEPGRVMMAFLNVKSAGPPARDLLSPDKN